MNIDILTLFPEFFKSPLEQSLLKRAQTNGICSIQAHDIRKNAPPPHFQVDDTSFGGGAGMVLKPEPLKKTIDECRKESSKVIYLSPQGTPLTQEKCVQ
ncbi:MAG: tRNA (guanine-N(1)-)-methyltransferase, partial [Chlamydiae bacterium]|nr:tRNA (guanine-N(1)-)-methyltransferase [Chlamydiota bacterium]